jgi:hypothetical protein
MSTSRTLTEEHKIKASKERRNKKKTLVKSSSFPKNNNASKKHADKVHVQQNERQVQVPLPFETYYQPTQQPYQDYAYLSTTRTVFAPPPTADGSNPAHCLTVSQRDVEYHEKNVRDTVVAANSLITGGDLSNLVYFYCMRVEAILSNHNRRNRSGPSSGYDGSAHAYPQR